MTLSRRQALAVMLAPLATVGCSVGDILSPTTRRQGLNSLLDTPEITLIGSGDAHAKTNLTNTKKTGAAALALLNQNPAALAFMVGDLAEHGLESEFALYDSTWGKFKERTEFQIGNCDLITDPTGSLWYDYTQAGEPGKYYYAKTYGRWRIYYLNSQCGVDLRTEQNDWLASDLPQWSFDHHIGAMWHQPRFASVCQHNGKAMVNNALQLWWKTLQQHGFEFVFSGHSHRYERFAQVLSDGTRSTDGARQFILGTGGPVPMVIKTVNPNSEKQAVTRGTMKLDLYADRYEWRFTDLSNVVKDSGVQLCRKVLV